MEDPVLRRVVRRAAVESSPNPEGHRLLAERLVQTVSRNLIARSLGL